MREGEDNSDSLVSRAATRLAKGLRRVADRNDVSAGSGRPLSRILAALGRRLDAWGGSLARRRQTDLARHSPAQRARRTRLRIAFAATGFTIAAALGYPLAEMITRKVERASFARIVEAYNGQHGAMFQMTHDPIQYRNTPGFHDRHAYSVPTGRRFEYRINSAGFRGAELPDLAEVRAAGGRIVLHVGDSFVFGMNVGEGEPFPARLNRKLGPSVVNVNGGVIGYNLPQYRDSLRENLPRLRPDIVTLNLYVNDFDRRMLERNPDIWLKDAGSWFLELRVKPALRKILPGLDLLRPHGPINPRGSHNEALDARFPNFALGRAAFLDIVALCRESGAELVVVSHPLILAPGFATDRYQYLRMNGIFRDWAAGAGCRFVDLREEILRSETRPESLVIPEDGHWEGGARGGHEFVANVLAREIFGIDDPQDSETPDRSADSIQPQ